jgi:hypothetical protein
MPGKHTDTYAPTDRTFPDEGSFNGSDDPDTHLGYSYWASKHRDEPAHRGIGYWSHWLEPETYTWIAGEYWR